MTHQTETSINLEEALKNGRIGLINLGVDTIVVVKRILGDSYDEDEGTISGTYLHWGNLRIYFNEEGISEYADILFLNRSTELGTYSCNPLNDKLTFRAEIDFPRLMKFLNFQGIEYKIVNSRADWDILEITVSKFIEMILRIEDDIILDRITFNK